MLLVSVPLLLTWWGRNRISCKKKKKKSSANKFLLSLFSVSRSLPIKSLFRVSCSRAPAVTSPWISRAHRELDAPCARSWARCAKEQGKRGGGVPLRKSDRSRETSRRRHPSTSSPFALLSSFRLSLSHTQERDPCFPHSSSPPSKNTQPGHLHRDDEDRDGRRRARRRRAQVPGPRPADEEADGARRGRRVPLGRHGAGRVVQAAVEEEELGGERDPEEGEEARGWWR